MADGGKAGKRQRPSTSSGDNEKNGGWGDRGRWACAGMTRNLRDQNLRTKGCAGTDSATGLLCSLFVTSAPARPHCLVDFGDLGRGPGFSTGGDRSPLSSSIGAAQKYSA